MRPSNWHHLDQHRAGLLGFELHDDDMPEGSGESQGPPEDVEVVVKTVIAFWLLIAAIVLAYILL